MHLLSINAIINFTLELSCQSKDMGNFMKYIDPVSKKNPVFSGGGGDFLSPKPKLWEIS